MAFQPVPDVLEVVCRWVNGSIPIVNTFYAEIPGGYIQPELDALATAVDAVIVSDWKPNMTALISYVSTDVRGLAQQNDLFAQSLSAAGAGALAGDALAPHSTYAIKRLSGFTGRSARGRIYWPGIAVSQAGGTRNEQIMATPRDNMIDAVDAMRLAIIALGDVPVIVSRFTGGMARAEGVTFEWLSTSVTDNYIDTQRRRSDA